MLGGNKSSWRLALLEVQNQTVEFRRGLTGIKQDLQRHREVIKELPKPADKAERHGLQAS